MNQDSGKRVEIGLIGCGRMGTALAAGLLARGEAVALRVFDVEPAARAAMAARAAELGAQDRLTVCGDLAAVSVGAGAVLLAVKPAAIVGCIERLRDQEPTLLVSVAAGMPVARMREAAGRHRVVRVMPNAPALVGEGMSVVLADAGAEPRDVEAARALLASVGEVAVVHDEELMHVVTALSGSGPAFAAVVIEALADGAVAEGLPRAVAYHLARQTVRGSMALLDTMAPAALKDAVMSPGGTTAAGIAAAEHGGLRAALIEAIRAASRRSREMSG